MLRTGTVTSESGHGSTNLLRGGNRASDFSTHDFHAQLISSLDLSRIGSMTDDEIRSEIRVAAGELCQQSSSLLTSGDRERLVNEVMDEAFGLGPLEALLHDPAISDILINGPKTVYVERRGKLELTDVVFADEPHLLQIIQRIVGRVGRRIDETSPIADARLADGSRVNAIIPPLALDGSLLCIRRFSAKPLKAEDLISKQSITKEMIEFLSGCVKARRNMLISGGTGSGKTTFLNCCPVISGRRTDRDAGRCRGVAPATEARCADGDPSREY